MPELQLPQSDKYSINSSLAFDNLRNYFPRHWKIIPIRDQLSSIEYGQDWLVLITNEKQQLTGKEFRIQSKVVTSKNKRRIGTVNSEMKVSTLNNLRNTSIPVLLHFFDSVIERGYWMWLDDWYDANHSDATEKEKEITVKISRNNIIDDNTARILADYINLVQDRTILVKKAMAASLRHPHYEFVPKVGLRSTSIEIYAKHQDAPPINFSITPINIDTDAALRHEERGEKLSFRGIFRLQTELPDFVTPSDKEMEFVLSPLVKPISFPASIEFISRNPENNYNIRYVRFDLIQEGTKFRKFVGYAFERQLVCTLEVDIPNESVSFSFGPNRENRSLRTIKTFLEFRRYASTFNQVHITSLEPYGNAYSEVPQGVFSDFSPEEELNYRLTNALMTIEAKAKVKFDLPERTDEQVVNDLEKIAEILSVGYTSKPMSEVNDFGDDKVLFVGTDVRTAEKMRNDLVEHPSIPVWYRFLEPTEVKIYKRKFKLGAGAYVFTVGRILDFSNFPAEITDENRDKLIQFPVQVDWAATITAFKDWLDDDKAFGIDWLRPHRTDFE